MMTAGCAVYAEMTAPLGTSHYRDVAPPMSVVQPRDVSALMSLVLLAVRQKDMVSAAPQ
jgi:hypothetical protein